jgi:flagellar biosynthetic protein FlhB
MLNRVNQAVPKADVVVTNPTELAVALKYDPETMAAPVVVAKGAGLVAQRIRKLAEEHGVPIIEKKPLAQALYQSCEVGRPIPVHLYRAVAEVLAYIYRLMNGRLPG